jgi:hypothetical protein
MKTDEKIKGIKKYLEGDDKMQKRTKIGRKLVRKTRENRTF